MKFKNLKAGDKVFVVRQQGRYQNEPNKGKLLDVAKVGRSYGYLENSWLSKFHLDNGYSFDEHNARANGSGFNVYIDEQDYLVETENNKTLAALKARRYLRNPHRAASCVASSHTRAFR